MKHKRMKTAVLLLVGLLILGVILCMHPKMRLYMALHAFSGTVEGDIPEDAQLTVYYIPGNIVFRAPVRDAEALIGSSAAEKVTVSYDELARNWASLRKLEPSMLEPVKGKAEMDLRIYYVLEVGGRKLLEVAKGFYGDAIVNGIEVEDDPVLYELIVPFLPQEDLEHVDFDGKYSAEGVAS